MDPALSRRKLVANRPEVDHHGCVDNYQAWCNCGWSVAEMAYSYLAREALFDHYREVGTFIKSTYSRNRVSQKKAKN